MREFKEINENSVRATELMQYVKGGNVLLEMRIDEMSKECYVTSYAYTIRGELMVYQPSHFLATGSSFGEKQVATDSAVQWRKRYSEADTYISIYDEFYFHCEYEADIDQFKALLSSLAKRTENSRTELYFSDDRANYYGPLEIRFMEWWLDNHIEYTCGIITEE